MRERRYVIVVAGLPRTGTSMMMRMLGAGGIPLLTDTIRPADEDNPHGYYEFEPVKRTRDDASWLTRAEGRAVKLVYRLLADLPRDRRYRVIFMHRHLGEVFASQQRMLARRVAPRDGAGPGTPPDLDRDTFERLFSGELSRAREWLAREPGFTTLPLHYREVVEDPEAASRQVDAFLDGGLDRVAMASVVDPRLHRQRA